MLKPVTLLIGMGLMACFHGIAPIATGLYLLYAVFGIEEPAGYAFLAQTPPDLSIFIGLRMNSFADQVIRGRIPRVR